MVRSEFEICHCIPQFTNNDSHNVVSLLSYLITKKKLKVHSEAFSRGLQINSLQRQGRSNNGTNKKLDDQRGHSKPESKSLDSEITYLLDLKLNGALKFHMFFVSVDSLLLELWLSEETWFYDNNFMNSMLTKGKPKFTTVILGSQPNLKS